MIPISVRPGNADRSRLPQSRRQRTYGDLLRRFGQAVAVNNRRAKDFLDLSQQFWRKRRRGGANESQVKAGGYLRIFPRLRQHRLMHRRYDKVPGRRKFAAPIEKQRGVKAGGADHAGTAESDASKTPIMPLT